MENKRFTLILEPISKRINVFEGSTVYKSILALNLPVGALCAGKGTCGKCLIRIVDPNAKISEPSEKEKKYLDNKKVLEGYRLACQTKILGDLRVFLTDSLMPKGYRILVDADLRTLGIKESDKITPIISSKLCKVASADLNNPKSDLSCLIEGISERDNNFKICENNRELHVNNILYRICKKLSKTIRKENGIVTAYFRKLFLKDSWILYDIDAGNKINKSFGLAIDIGTTTIVGYLIYLKTGEIVAISSMLNPHVAFGEDIISRIAYIIKNNGIEKAKNTLVSALNQILENCCEKTNISASCVKDISIVCNTGIYHMLFGLNPEFLSMSPYIPVFKAPTNISAHILGIKCNPNVNVYSPPVIAGYVGTDTIGCIISSKINTYDKYSLLIDIGTNGELVLGNKKGLVTCSCAAGSAFEGAQILHGMRASEGAIESVIIDRDTLEPSIGVIGNINPLGLCGSGLIDTIAEMLKSKIITRAGNFNSKSKQVLKHRRIVKREDGYHYILYKADWDIKQFQLINNYRNTSEITISQKDINQLQLAKGAFLSAANLLIEMENKQKEFLEQIILAGGFGTYINKENAAFIGLFPEVEQNNIFQIGNAAGTGAQLFIRDLEQRDLANKIAHEVKYREIAASPSFPKEYTFSLYFPHYELDRFPIIRQEYNDIPLN